MSNHADLTIVGGGSSGGVLAILLSKLDFTVNLVDTRDPDLPFEPDSRAFAIVRGGWRVLEAAGVAEAIDAGAQPLAGMEAHDQNGVLPDAASMFGVEDLPETGEPLGRMVEVDQLNTAIRDQVKKAKNVTVHAPETVKSLNVTPETATVTLSSGEELTSDLVVGADGVGSAIREFAGINTIGWAYNQSVVAVTVQLDTSHGAKARQWFQPEGPFAVLPLTDNRANIAWFRTGKAAEATVALSREALEQEINGRFSHLAGSMKVLRDPLSYPLRLRMAERMVDKRVALVGDAVRRINPLAGQGFNLGLKDVAALVECLIEARRTGLSVANGTQLESYQQWRRFDGITTALAMDAINKTFSNDSALLSPFKKIALSAGNFSPLRSMLARQASADQKNLPALVRGEGLDAFAI